MQIQCRCLDFLINFNLNYFNALNKLIHSYKLNPGPQEEGNQREKWKLFIRLNIIF